MRATERTIERALAMRDRIASSSALYEYEQREMIDRLFKPWLTFERSSDVVPFKRIGIRFLERDGNLRVPGGRYGSDTRDCAPIAWRIAYLVGKHSSGDPVTFADLEHAMGMVVNSHDDVAYMVNNYGHGNYGRR